MELKFSAATRPAKPDAAILRRQKLVRRIDQQVGFIRQMIGGKIVRTAWVWMDGEGTYFLPIHYGRQQIELQKGKFVIECPDLDHVEEALCTIRAMVIRGDFDVQLATASANIRGKFGKA